ncbi:MAG: ABC transporter ATP-binding protein [Balneolaceae bacterium]
MIELRELTKVYTTDEIETTAIRRLDLTIANGEFIAVMGPSGCGKSTLLNLLGLLDEPTSGSYKLMGEETAHFSEKERAAARKGAIGFVFQSFNLIDELTVYENVELPLLYLGVPAGERAEKAERALERMNMMPRKNHFPQQLSGGQQQRVAIARAVVAEAKLILADEPTGNLDSDNGNEVMSLLSELNEQGTTIVMVTHSPHDATYAKRIIRLFDGEIVEQPKEEQFHV